MASVGAAGPWGWTRLKCFQGLEGQWKGWSLGLGEADGLEDVASSSDDSSLAGALEGGCVVEGECDGAGGGESAVGAVSMFLRGDQPGGRRRI